MCLGVLIFILAYTVGDGLTAGKQWRRDRRTRLTLRIGYLTRLVISVVFPLGGFVDLHCGLVSIRIVGFLMNFQYNVPQEANFAQTLAITLVQGLILNAMLVGFMLIVYAVQLVISETFPVRQ